MNGIGERSRRAAGYINRDLTAGTRSDRTAGPTDRTGVRCGGERAVLARRVLCGGR